MRKYLFLLLSFCFLLACTPSQDNPKPLIYTSFHAMYDFTRTIAGDAFEVALLLPPGADAHHWEPTARDMARLAEAEAFIFHGAGMEHFVPRLLASLEGETLFVEASAALSDNTQSDPHLWLNPLYALQQMEAIKNALSEIAPHQGHIFEANFEYAAQRLFALDEAFRHAAENFTRRDIVVSHGAFGHLSTAYGLNQLAIEGGGHHGEPSPARMVEIIHFVQENGVTTIFYDKNPAIATAIAQETGTVTARLDTFEGFTPYDYFTVMQRNLAALVEALS